MPVPSSRRFPLRVLVVDDVSPVRDLLAEILRAEGYDTETAPDPDTALQLAELLRWDLVILDVDLPGMDGFELYARIRHTAGGEPLPAVFISGRPGDLRRHALDRLPWVRFIAKPFKVPPFLEAVAQCLLTKREPASDRRG